MTRPIDADDVPDIPKPDRLMSSVLSMAQDAVERLELFRDLLLEFQQDQDRSAQSMARWQDRAAALLMDQAE